AAAKVAGKGNTHFLFRRVGVVAQEFDEGRENAGGAVAALETVILVKGLLQGMQLVRRWRNTFNRQQLGRARLHRKHQAWARGASVKENGARAADPVLAAQMCTGEPELPADEVRERDTHLDLVLIALAVDNQANLALLAHWFS